MYEQVYFLDLRELDVPDGIKVEMIENLKLSVKINPCDGYYKDAIIPFSIQFNYNYPWEAPKVKCISHIFHPNIDYDGNVCLNILRLDWSPVHCVNSILLGLWILLMEPTGEEPLCKDAGELLERDPMTFHKVVRETLKGEIWKDKKYDSLII